MESPCLCPSEGHKHGGRDVTKTSVVAFCYCFGILEYDYVTEKPRIGKIAWLSVLVISFSKFTTERRHAAAFI